MGILIFIEILVIAGVFGVFYKKSCQKFSDNIVDCFTIEKKIFKNKRGGVYGENREVVRFRYGLLKESIAFSGRYFKEPAL